MRTYRVRQQGNRVEVLDGTTTIFYELGGVELPEISDFSFAVWHLLPLAMKEGFDFHIDGPVDAVALENARRMSRTWEQWRPREFREIRITSASEAAPVFRARERMLTLFSGGIDSTHMLLTLGRQAEPMPLLTVHGMDYALKNPAKFQDLLAMTQPLTEDLGYKRITIRSDAMRVATGYHAWGMAIAGHAFLLSGLFEEARFAADYSWEQDAVAFPWGLNHITNRYFQGSNFAVRSLCEDTTRAEKVALIARNPLALASASFCKIRSHRPRNCGTCSKCLRTKAMFAGMLGHIPDIFLDGQFSRETIDLIDFEDPIEQAFLMDLFQRARALGHLDALPGFEEKINRVVKALA